tara:strand:+ start:233 stop:481 length:249 start_codon:yes stop_codon:yes gene_type:complete
MLKALQDFFASKKVESMTLAEYKGYGSDVPVKDYLLRRHFGSWSRVLSVAKHRHGPVEVPVEEVVVEKPKTVTKKEVKDDVK